MSSRRTIILMGILLALVVGYIAKPIWQQAIPSGVQIPVDEPPLAGMNQISGLTVDRDSKGRWTASFDYFYTGGPPGGQLKVGVSRNVSELTEKPSAGQTFVRPPAFAYVPVRRGSHHVSVELQRPHNAEPTTTTQVVVLLVARGETIASQQIAQTIDWPDFQTWALELELAQKTRDQILDQAIGLIDIGDRASLAHAKRLLERLVRQDAQFDAAYIELARVAMKTNWGPEGLHQAEKLLQSALQIRPDNVNAKILLGYVYAHQVRYKPAETMFIDASRTDTKNLWLWANWGELLVMQGKLEMAAEKYREALSRPRSHDQYDRARVEAYSRLIVLLERRKDLDGMEALYKQQAEEFGAGSCSNSEYARFLLQQRGDTAGAIALARQVLNHRCTDIRTRDVLGMALYVDWANTSGPDRSESLNQARVFLPSGSRLMYLLATGERTVGAAKQLVASGESVDQRDNAQVNALAYALQARDYAAASRLLRLGARPDATVTFEDIPVAMLPVLNRDQEGIRLLQRAGVDFSKVRYRGISALEYAKQTGDRRLIDALDPRVRAI